MAEWRYQLLAFLTTALDGSELSASRPGRFSPSTHWVTGWVDPRVGLDAMTFY